MSLPMCGLTARHTGACAAAVRPVIVLIKKLIGAASRRGI
jgi:hypothetical protein